MSYTIYRVKDGKKTEVAIADNLAEAGKIADACRAVENEGAEYLIKRREDRP